MPKLFSDYVPQTLKDGNIFLQQYLDVLDNLLLTKNTETGYIEDVFNPVRLVRTPSTNFMKKYLQDFGQLANMGGFPAYLLERLIMNSFNICDLRGTPDGFRLWMYSVADASVIVNDTNLISQLLIQPDSYTYGYCPNGLDLGNYPDMLMAIGSGNTLDEFNNSVEVRTIGPYYYVSEFRDFMVNEIPTWLPGVDINTTDIIVRFYPGLNTSDRGIHNWLYNDTGVSGIGYIKIGSTFVVG